MGLVAAAGRSPAGLAALAADGAAGAGAFGVETGAGAGAGAGAGLVAGFVAGARVGVGVAAAADGEGDAGLGGLAGATGVAGAAAFFARDLLPEDFGFSMALMVRGLSWMRDGRPGVAGAGWGVVARGGEARGGTGLGEEDSAEVLAAVEGDGALGVRWGVRSADGVGLGAGAADFALADAGADAGGGDGGASRAGEVSAGGDKGRAWPFAGALAGGAGLEAAALGLEAAALGLEAGVEDRGTAMGTDFALGRVVFASVFGPGGRSTVFLLEADFFAGFITSTVEGAVAGLGAAPGCRAPGRR